MRGRGIPDEGPAFGLGRALHVGHDAKSRNCGAINHEKASGPETISWHSPAFADSLLKDTQVLAEEFVAVSFRDDATLHALAKSLA